MIDRQKVKKKYDLRYRPHLRTFSAVGSCLLVLGILVLLALGAIIFPGSLVAWPFLLKVGVGSMLGASVLSLAAVRRMSYQAKRMEEALRVLRQEIDTVLYQRDQSTDMQKSIEDFLCGYLVRDVTDTSEKVVKKFIMYLLTQFDKKTSVKALGEMLLQDALDRGEQERDECLSRRLLVGSSLAVMNFEQWEREGRQQAKTSQPAEFGGTSAAINIGLGGGGVSGEPVDHYAQEGTPLRFVTERSYPVNYRGINQQHNPSSVDFSLGGYSSDSERLSMGEGN